MKNSVRDYAKMNSVRRKTQSVRSIRTSRFGHYVTDGKKD